MKKWYSETVNVDIETGEVLSKSRIKRENWLRKGTDTEEVVDCGGYLLKKRIVTWKANPQLNLKL